MQFSKLLIGICCLVAFINPSLAQEKIKIGVPTALTGDATPFGLDIKNALTLMNEKFGNDRYQLVFEDEQCINREAVQVANKLIGIDKIRFALGFPCNQSLLATAPIYEKAGVLVITSSANSGDVQDIGKHIFRLFPADAEGAKLLYRYIAARHKKLLILTEQTEYPVMMERTIRKENDASSHSIQIMSKDFIHGETNLRSMLVSTLAGGIDAIFINANTDTSFISVVQQLKSLNYTGARYAAYLPASDVTLKALGDDLNGFVFCNLPLSDQLMTAEGKALMEEFRKRFGEPKSGFPAVPTSFEAYRVLTEALQSGSDPLRFISTTKFKGKFIPDFYFDSHGAVQGINFQLQRIDKRKVKIIPPEQVSP